MNTPDRLLRLPEVRARTGLGRDSVYRLAKAGEFPRPVKVSERASAWLESEVQAFIAQRIAARDERPVDFSQVPSCPNATARTARKSASGKHVLDVNSAVRR